MKKLFIYLAFWITPTLVWAQQSYQHGPGMMWENSGWWGFGMWLPLLLLLGLVVLVVWAASRFIQSSKKSSTGSADKTALDILKERFARGELNEKEFEERRRALQD